MEFIFDRSLRFSPFSSATEFFEAQASKLQRRKDAMLAEWQAECERVQQRKDGAHAARIKAEAEYANARTQQEAERAEKALKDAIASLKVRDMDACSREMSFSHQSVPFNLQEAVKEKEPPAPNLDFESNPDEEELYFREPQQLLAVYQELEESNLFYIQNAQETEEALEELRAKLRDTKVRMDSEVDSLNSQVTFVDASPPL